MQKVASIFDIIGPVMVGPSSSHTAGAVRLGVLARAIYGGEPARARISLHGSFAATSEGHGTKRALVAGLLGMGVDDIRIVDAPTIARQRGHDYTFQTVDIDEAHPNTVLFELGEGDGIRFVQGSSIGGGNVQVTHIDGFTVAIDGTLPLLVLRHRDKPGAVSAATEVLARSGINIATMQVSRQRRGQEALTLIETDTPLDPSVLTSLIALKKISSVVTVPVV